MTTSGTTAMASRSDQMPIPSKNFVEKRHAWEREREHKPITKRLWNETAPSKLRSNRERTTYYEHEQRKVSAKVNQ